MLLSWHSVKKTARTPHVKRKVKVEIINDDDDDETFVERHSAIASEALAEQ